MRLCGRLGLFLVAFAAAAPAQSLASLHGQVSDPAGAVIANAGVTLLSRERITKARTDANGEFSFGSLPPGTDELEIESAGFNAFHQLVAVQPGEARVLDATLGVGSACGVPDPVLTWVSASADERVISGKLRGWGRRSRPLRKAIVTLLPVDAHKPDDTPRTVAAAPEGEFSFSQPPPGIYRLRVSARKYQPLTSRDFLVPRESRVTAAVQLLETGTVLVCQ